VSSTRLALPKNGILHKNPSICLKTRSFVCKADATVRGINHRGGLDIDVHVPGCTTPVTLTNIVFNGKDGGLRGSCFKEG
jgi:hypothetical protein